MSSDIINHILQRQYTAHKGEDLLSQVHKIVCVVSPDALVSAGFHPSGEILVVNSSKLDNEHWSAAFIEHELLNDPLLAAPEMIKSIFVAATKNMIIPNELFTDDATSAQWLKATFHCENSEKIKIQDLEKSEAHNCFSFPKSIEDVFNKYTVDVPVFPLNFIHFKNSVAAENLLQCTITDGFATATLHFNKTLHWHQTFEYTNAEDIAFKLATACNYFGIDIHTYPVHFTTTSIDMHLVLKKLQQLFPASKQEKTGIADIISPEWSATIHLFQQLYQCV